MNFLIDKLRISLIIFALCGKVLATGLLMLLSISGWLKPSHHTTAALENCNLLLLFLI